MPWVIAGLLIRLGLLPINHAEYTDGVLQIEALRLRIGLYPPLYGILATAISASGLSLEMAGKLISAIASALTVLPLWWLIRLAGGRPSAAAWGAALFTVCPLVLRWSIRVMTDSLFLGLATTAMACWTAALMVPPNQNRQVQSLTPRLQQYLIWGLVASVFATLTRWQGLALLPLGILVTASSCWRHRHLLVVAVLSHAIWLVIPLSGWLVGFAHGRQFSERTTTHITTTLLAYWNTAESFVLIAPYYFGYPLVALAVAQVVRFGWGKWSGQIMLLWTLYAIAFISAQSAFGSFQYRYMLPLLPPILVAASLCLDRLIRLRQSLAWAGAAGTILFLVLKSAAVLTLQRGTFGDQKEAVQWMVDNLPHDIPTFSNERYGNFAEVGSLKQSRWAGRMIQPFQSPADLVGKRAALVLSNAYGGDAAVSAAVGTLVSTHNIRPLFAAERRIIPLHDDVMASPMLNQNPMGWVFRYAPQNFRTTIFLVEPRP